MLVSGKKFETVSQCRKCKNGDPLGFLTFTLLQNFKKKLKGRAFGELKIFRNKNINAPKN